MNPLHLAYSPCPNDTYIFHAWVQGLLPDAPPVVERLEDIDTLNALALRGEPDVVKVSFGAYPYLRARYALLHSGGALGRGCGPLVVARAEELGAGARPGVAVGPGGPAPGADEAARSLLTTGRVAIPGRLTTATLLLSLFAPGLEDLVVLPYDRIMPAVAAGEVAAGVIIHESRFTYPQHGLVALVDLGEWWERTTGHPIPLGGVVVRRDLSPAVAGAVDRAVRAGLERARIDPAASQAYIRRYAQEMDPVVCEQHIRLYVTDFSNDYGPEGEAAIRDLLQRAAGLPGAAPATDAPLFWDGERA